MIIIENKEGYKIARIEIADNALINLALLPEDVKYLQVVVIRIEQRQKLKNGSRLQ